MKKRMNNVISYILLAFTGLLYLVPFYILCNLALKKPIDSSSKWIPPQYFYPDNFFEAWTNASLDRALLNNLFITLVSVILIILIGSIASYPLSRNKTKINNLVFTIFISCMVVPNLTCLVPLYKFVVDIKGMNSYWCIVLLHLVFQLPTTIFLYTGFINTIPKELDESGLIDGCNIFKTFFMIILPLLKPVTSTVIIMVGVAIWNDYNLSLFFLQDSTVQNLTIRLSLFFSQYNNYIERCAAGCIMGMLPMVILYLFLQKYFIKGLSAGAIKA